MIVAFVRLVIGLVAALALPLAGFGLAEYWEHRPRGEPAWAHVSFLWWHWSAPDSLAAQRDRARKDLVVANASVALLERAVQLQNDRLAAISAAGSRASADAANAVTAYASGQERVSSQVAAVSQPLKGDDECIRIGQVDSEFLGAIR